jgi:hypothetical protein
MRRDQPPSFLAGVLGSRIVSKHLPSLSQKYGANPNSSSTSGGGDAEAAQLQRGLAEDEFDDTPYLSVPGVDYRTMRRDDLITLLLKTISQRDLAVASLRKLRQYGDYAALSDSLARAQREKDAAMSMLQALKEDVTRIRTASSLVTTDGAAQSSEAVDAAASAAAPGGSATASTAGSAAVPEASDPATVAAAAASDVQPQLSASALRQELVVAKVEAAQARLERDSSVAAALASAAATEARLNAEIARLKDRCQVLASEAGSLKARVTDARYRSNALELEIDAVRLENARLKVAMSAAAASGVSAPPATSYAHYTPASSPQPPLVASGSHGSLPANGSPPDATINVTQPLSSPSSYGSLKQAATALSGPSSQRARVPTGGLGPPSADIQRASSVTDLCRTVGAGNVPGGSPLSPPSALSRSGSTSTAQQRNLGATGAYGDSVSSTGASLAVARLQQRVGPLSPARKPASSASSHRGADSSNQYRGRAGSAPQPISPHKEGGPRRARYDSQGKEVLAEEIAQPDLPEADAGSEAIGLYELDGHSDGVGTGTGSGTGDRLADRAQSDMDASSHDRGGHNNYGSGRAPAAGKSGAGVEIGDRGSQRSSIDSRTAAAAPAGSTLRPASPAAQRSLDAASGAQLSGRYRASFSSDLGLTLDEWRAADRDNTLSIGRTQKRQSKPTAAAALAAGNTGRRPSLVSDGGAATAKPVLEVAGTAANEAPSPAPAASAASAAGAAQPATAVPAASSAAITSAPTDTVSDVSRPNHGHSQSVPPAHHQSHRSRFSLLSAFSSLTAGIAAVGQESASASSEGPLKEKSAPVGADSASSGRSRAGSYSKLAQNTSSASAQETTVLAAATPSLEADNPTVAPVVSATASASTTAKSGLPLSSSSWGLGNLSSIFGTAGKSRQASATAPIAAAVDALQPAEGSSGGETPNTGTPVPGASAANPLAKLPSVGLEASPSATDPPAAASSLMSAASRPPRPALSSPSRRIGHTRSKSVPRELARALTIAAPASVTGGAQDGVPETANIFLETAAEEMMSSIAPSFPQPLITPASSGPPSPKNGPSAESAGSAALIISDPGPDASFSNSHSEPSHQLTRRRGSLKPMSPSGQTKEVPDSVLVARVMNLIPLFRSLDPVERSVLAAALVTRRYGNHDAIHRAGETGGDAVYIVLDGVVSVLAPLASTLRTSAAQPAEADASISKRGRSVSGVTGSSIFPLGDQTGMDSANGTLASRATTDLRRRFNVSDWAPSARFSRGDYFIADALPPGATAVARGATTCMVMESGTLSTLLRWFADARSLRIATAVDNGTVGSDAISGAVAGSKEVCVFELCCIPMIHYIYVQSLPRRLQKLRLSILGCSTVASYASVLRRHKDVINNLPLQCERTRSIDGLQRDVEQVRCKSTTIRVMYDS